MKVELFNYNLPRELIAQVPVTPRDTSRLLVFNRKKNKISHDHFYNLPKHLTSNDVLVFNNSKVFPARIKINKSEIFLLKQIDSNIWECLGKKIKDTGFKIDNLEIKILEKKLDGKLLVHFNLFGVEFNNWLEENAETPLPPYIKTSDSENIRKKYQTIYAKPTGSVAAPTAGLHFTEKLLNELNKKGVQTEFVTLHVGLGTFQPVKAEKVEQHVMHAEWADLDSTTCERLNSAKKSNKRIIAVGTTSVRVLESCTDASGLLKPFSGELNIFIKPDYKFKFVNSLITNFHLPKSSLLMLVSAFLNSSKHFWQTKKFGIKKIKQIYQLAIQKKYRFYSFGDSMLIE